MSCPHQIVVSGLTSQAHIPLASTCILEVKMLSSLIPREHLLKQELDKTSKELKKELDKTSKELVETKVELRVLAADMMSEFKALHLA